jgi:hypothetical protein
MKAILLLGTAALFAAPAAAHAQAAMPGMDMAPTAPPKEPAPIPAPVDDHAAPTAPAETAPDQPIRTRGMIRSPLEGSLT